MWAAKICLLTILFSTFSFKCKIPQKPWKFTNNYKRVKCFPEVFMYNVHDIKRKKGERTKNCNIRDYIVLSHKKWNKKIPPYIIGILFTCHTVEQIQTYLCENKMVFDNRRKGNLANICTCTNASLFLEPFQLANDSQIYTSLPKSLIEEDKIYEQMSDWTILHSYSGFWQC